MTSGHWKDFIVVEPQGAIDRAPTDWDIVLLWDLGQRGHAIFRCIFFLLVWL